MPRVIIWQVTGMTCRSCEKRIGDVLKNLPGVIETDISVKLSKAAVRLHDGARNPDLDALNRELSTSGYVLYPEGCAVPGRREKLSARLRRALPALALAGIALLLLSPLRKIVPSVSAGASIGALFLLGVVASISTCLATTGGFMLAYSAEVNSKRKTILMHVGRLLAFTIGGALLGAIGGALPTGSAVWYGLLGLILGVGFLAVALNLLDLSPSLAQMGIGLPSSFHALADRIRKRPGTAAPLLVGAVTFILPCGFTQTAQALALASGSWTKGAALLFAFALGTLPVLLGVTTFATKATMRHRVLRLAVGAVMFFFAISQIDGGLTLLGSPMTFATLARSFAPSGSAQISDIVGNEQVVKMDVLSYGYSPNSFTIRKGVPVRWEINGVDVGGCTNAIVSRQLGISQRLKPGLNVITFTPKQTGAIAFACGMGMVRGTFNVL